MVRAWPAPLPVAGNDGAGAVAPGLATVGVLIEAIGDGVGAGAHLALGWIGGAAEAAIEAD